MIKRTTIDIDQDLLARAKSALGLATARATVDEALRRAAAAVAEERAERATRQLLYLRGLESLADLSQLASDRMWR